MPLSVLATMTAIAYLVGSIPFGLLLARQRGIDIRHAGSGNIGATNVARSLGKKLGALVLILDASKGAVPVAVVLLLVEPTDAATATTSVGFSAIVGHCYPVWLQFRGGKGVATALGALLLIEPILLAIAVGIFTTQVALFGKVSFGSLAAALCCPLLAWRLEKPDELVMFTAAVSLLVLWRHRGNLRRLARNREHAV